MTGLSYEYLSHVESDEKTPSFDVLLKICSALQKCRTTYCVGRFATITMTVLQDKGLNRQRESKKPATSNLTDWLSGQYSQV